MTAEVSEAAARPRPPRWVLAPLEGVGPLRFGMSVDEVAAVLPDALVLSQFKADPFCDDVGVQLGFRPGEPAVHAYFTRGRLYCVAADAGFGPRVWFNGLEWTGGDPESLEQALPGFDADTCHVVSYGPRGNPGVNKLGLVLRVQEVRNQVLTRPVMVGREWADRCADDWEGRIPECEWVGRQWRNWMDSFYFPPPGYTPPWAKVWHPPF